MGASLALLGLSHAGFGYRDRAVGEVGEAVTTGQRLLEGHTHTHTHTHGHAHTGPTSQGQGLRTVHWGDEGPAVGQGLQNWFPRAQERETDGKRGSRGSDGGS